LFSFVHIFTFWYHVPRKIWQPWCEIILNCFIDLYPIIRLLNLQQQRQRYL
jgi:hypothetical protein